MGKKVSKSEDNIATSNKFSLIKSENVICMMFLIFWWFLLATVEAFQHTL